MKKSSDTTCGILFTITAFTTYALTISRTIHLEWAWTISFGPNPPLSHLIYPPVLLIPSLSVKDTCPFSFSLSSPNPSSYRSVSLSLYYYSPHPPHLPPALISQW